MDLASRFIVVTGISGSGRSTCLRALEDMGYYCVDNLPSALLPALKRTLTPEAQTHVAVGIDVRAGQFLGDLEAGLAALRKEGTMPELVFLDCADDVLIRRFAETRRKHPILQATTISEAIRQERAAVLDVREQTALIVDTSDMNVHQLKRHIQRLFNPEYSAELRLMVSVLSFGYKYGLPRDADYVLDARYLENPYFFNEFTALSGLDPAVRDFVMSRGGKESLEKMVGLIDHVLPQHAKEGRALVTIAVGCTGGQHRSVALAEEMARHIETLRFGQTTVTHRDCKPRPPE